MPSKLYQRLVKAKFVVLGVGIAAAIIVGSIRRDATVTLLGIILSVILSAFLEIVSSTMKNESAEEDIRKIRELQENIMGHFDLEADIVPELKPRLKEMSKHYDASRQRHLPLFGTLAEIEMRGFEEKLRSLSHGVYELRHQPPQVVHDSWEPMVALAARGDVVLATSSVTAEWWAHNQEWEKANQALVDKGVGVIRIFLPRTLKEYEDLKPYMRRQAKMGIQINVAFGDEITKLGRRARDIMLVKSKVSDMNNPINNGKQVSEGVALGEQHLLDNHQDWQALTMTDDPQVMEEACNDLTTYLRASKRFEDDSWATDFFDADLHLIMSSKDPDTSTEVETISALLQCKPGGRYLDLGTGYGRIANPLIMRAPVTVMAVEQSHDLLDELQRDLARRLYEEPERNRAVKGVLIPKCCDIRDLLKEQDVAEGSFDGAFSVFDSFGYYEAAEENQKVLNVAGKLLKPGGVLILDLINPRQVHRRQGHHDWGKGVSSYAYWDQKRQRLLESYVIKNTVFKFKPLVSLRIYDLSEIRDCLKEAGFDYTPGNLKTCGAFSVPPSPYDDHSPRLIVVTYKK
jgi:SAM-dependent methyltransferase